MEELLQLADYNILVVDDDENITDLIRMYLANKGFHVLCAGNGVDGLSMVQNGNVHLIVLDLMMPDMDGWELCKRVREQSDVPILMVTARGESTDKLQGFSLGADDYIVKPFNPNELVARVTSMLARTYTRKKVTPLTAIQFDTLLINTVSHVVTVRGELADLSPREYQLLRMFADHPNQVLDRQQLLDLVWGIDYIGEDRVVDVVVKRLRKKLRYEHEKWSIRTIRGTGYQFKVEG